MHGWYKVFLSIWLIFYSMSYAKMVFVQPIYLVVLAAIIFVVAMMEVIKKK